MPVLSVHAPCLLISQRVWGANPISKLERSVRAAEQLGAQTVVVHPPFRWQRRYAEGFSASRWPSSRPSSDVMVAVENMFPFRADRFFGAGQTSIERMRKRGGRPGPGISAFAPSYDPLDGEPRPLHAGPVAHRDGGHRRDRHGQAGWATAWCTCTCATAAARRPTSIWCPAAAPSPPSKICEMLAAGGFSGHVILEVTTSGARTAAEREMLLTESLAIRPRAPAALNRR